MSVPRPDKSSPSTPLPPAQTPIDTQQEGQIHHHKVKKASSWPSLAGLKKKVQSILKSIAGCFSALGACFRRQKAKNPEPLNFTGKPNPPSAEHAKRVGTKTLLPSSEPSEQENSEQEIIDFLDMSKPLQGAPGNRSTNRPPASLRDLPKAFEASMPIPGTGGKYTEGAIMLHQNSEGNSENVKIIKINAALGNAEVETINRTKKLFC